MFANAGRYMLYGIRKPLLVSDGVVESMLEDPGILTSWVRIWTL